MLPPKQTLVPLPGRMTLLHQLPKPRIIWLDEVPSTHNYLKALLAERRTAAEELTPYTMIAARRQTAGRGQRGNHWESEDFKNLTFSMVAYPERLSPAMQFSISEAVALSVAALLKQYGIMAKVKWPNDIYVGDRKICGILIDHALTGSRIDYSVISAGLNINQQDFRSDAPNPVSMWQVAGREFDIAEIAERLRQIIYELVEAAGDAEGRAALHKAFMENLYRGDGEEYEFFDVGRNERIRARIADVSPQGLLTLELVSTTPQLRTYAFKEVQFIVESLESRV